MTALHGNKTSINFSKLPLAFCNGFTLKKQAYWNKRPILQAGTTINTSIIDFYKDIAMNIPVSIKMDQPTNKLEQQLFENMSIYKQQNTNKTNLSVSLSDGEILIKEGDSLDKDCYILIQGVLSISINGKNITHLSDHGILVGEMSFLTGEPRSATVTSKGESTVLRLRKADKNRLLRNNPTITMTILEALVSRLDDNNNKLVLLKDKFSSNINKTINQSKKIEQSYNTVVKTLMREAGIKKGNLEVLCKMQNILQEHFGSKLNSGDINSVYRIFLDFVEYYRKQSINEDIEGLILKENMPKLMKELF